MLLGSCSIIKLANRLADELRYGDLSDNSYNRLGINPAAKANFSPAADDTYIDGLNKYHQDYRQAIQNFGIGEEDPELPTKPVHPISNLRSNLNTTTPIQEFNTRIGYSPADIHAKGYDPIKTPSYSLPPGAIEKTQIPAPTLGGRLNSLVPRNPLTRYLGLKPSPWGSNGTNANYNAGTNTATIPTTQGVTNKSVIQDVLATGKHELGHRDTITNPVLGGNYINQVTPRLGLVPTPTKDGLSAYAGEAAAHFRATNNPSVNTAARAAIDVPINSLKQQYPDYHKQWSEYFSRYHQPLADRLLATKAHQFLNYNVQPENPLPQYTGPNLPTQIRSGFNGLVENAPAIAKGIGHAGISGVAGVMGDKLMDNVLPPKDTSDTYVGNVANNFRDTLKNMGGGAIGGYATGGPLGAGAGAVGGGINDFIGKTHELYNNVHDIGQTMSTRSSIPSPFERPGMHQFATSNKAPQLPMPKPGNIKSMTPVPGQQ